MLLVWDLETVSDDANPSSVGFPKLIYHSIVCIGALAARRVQDGWSIEALGAQPAGEKSEKQLIESFVDLVAEHQPQMVTFNGHSFDLPVLRYRAMIHGISSPGLHSMPYYHRFTDHHTDLCDVLSSFNFGGKAKLDEISRVMGLPGKPDGVTFDLNAGTKLVHVPYRGSAAALTDLLSGQIKTMFGDLLVVLPQVRAGAIRALAVTSKSRNPLLPDVPTMDEGGLPGFEVLSWQGMFAPAGTPPDVVERLSKDIRAVMESRDVKDFFAAQGFEVGATTPAEFKSFVTSEVARWAEIVKAGNVKAQ